MEMTLAAIYWLGVSAGCLYAFDREWARGGWLFLSFAWPAIPLVTLGIAAFDWAEGLWRKK
jgi:hypothetical protein